MTSRRLSAVCLQATKSLFGSSSWTSRPLFHPPHSKQIPQGPFNSGFWTWWAFSFMPGQGRNSSLWNIGRKFSWRGADGEKVLYSLIGANAFIFAAFQIDEFRGFMFRHFTCSLQQLKNMQLYTMLTSTFAHEHFGHLAVNMLALFFFGRSLATVMPGRQFLNLYLVGGLAGSVADAWSKLSTSKRSRWGIYDARTLGASGAVKAITTLYICLFPKDIIYLNFFIPVPAFLLGLGFLLHDFSGFMKNEGNISHAAHLGGVAIGLLYFLRLRYWR